MMLPKQKLSKGYIFWTCTQTTGGSICDVNHWFSDWHFEASSLDFGSRHLVFLEPEVTMFGSEGDAELIVLRYQTIVSLLS